MKIETVLTRTEKNSTFQIPHLNTSSRLIGVRGKTDFVLKSQNFFLVFNLTSQEVEHEDEYGDPPVEGVDVLLTTPKIPKDLSCLK